MMIPITSHIMIADEELQFDFIRASGPGGQNVNKVASAVQLRFNVGQSNNLPDDVRERLYQSEKNRINREGELIIHAKRFRSQEKNRQDAISRLVRIIQKATEKPKVRKKTTPSRKAKQERLADKRKRSMLKQNRNKTNDD